MVKNYHDSKKPIVKLRSRRRWGQNFMMRRNMLTLETAQRTVAALFCDDENHRTLGRLDCPVRPTPAWRFSKKHGLILVEHCDIAEAARSVERSST